MSSSNVIETPTKETLPDVETLESQKVYQKNVKKLSTKSVPKSVKKCGKKCLKKVSPKSVKKMPGDCRDTA